MLEYTINWLMTRRSGQMHYKDEKKTIRCTAIGSLTYLEIPVYDINTIYAMLYTKFNKWHS